MAPTVPPHLEGRQEEEKLVAEPEPAVSSGDTDDKELPMMQLGECEPSPA